MTTKDAYPIPRDVGFGVCVLTNATQKAGSAENGFCVRAGIIPVEEDAVRIVQRDGHIKATGGPGTNERNQEIRVGAVLIWKAPKTDM